MATTSHTPSTPNTPPSHAAPTDPQEIKNKLAEEDAEKMRKLNEETQTVADEQRKRSDEMDAHGVDKWMKEHEPRPDEPQKQVPGVAKAK